MVFVCSGRMEVSHSTATSIWGAISKSSLSITSGNFFSSTAHHLSPRRSTYRLSLLSRCSIDHGTNILHILAGLFLNPTSSPALKTCGFLDCVIAEGSTRYGRIGAFVSDRVSLHRVVIVGPGEDSLLSAASVKRLRKQVPVVEVIEGWGLPAYLS